MKCVGILGGSSDKSTAEYYRLMNAQVNARLGGWNTARVIIDSMNFAYGIRFTREGIWEEAGIYLAERAAALEAAGADLLICAANTLHCVADVFTAQLRIPFIHIVDPTAAAIRDKGLGTVALLGTRPVMSTPFLKQRYLDRFGIRVVVPDTADQVRIENIIFEELCKGVISPESKDYFLQLLRQLQKEGAEGAILGCTEIPLLIAQADRPDFPMFDTAALHVQAAVDAALAD